MDLDRFKEINDTLGHQAGDLLLRAIGRRLSRAAEEAAAIGRLGGDEFAILFRAADETVAGQMADGLLHIFDDPFTIREQSFYIHASIGAVIFPNHGEDVEALLSHADVALYVAKRNGGGYALYQPEQDHNTPDRLALIGELRHAIENDMLCLHFQPVINVTSGRLVRVEALVRWQHPQHGLIPPDAFISLAEQTGLIQALTRWVLQAVLRQQCAWQEAGFVVPVAVNLSMRDLHDPRLPEIIAELLREWDIPASALIVEVTESAIMADMTRTHTVLTGIHVLGIRIAIDDFGSGYTSMAHLKTLPIDEMKIDKSFVKSAATDPSGAQVLRAIIELGHSFNLTVVAEGVEDQVTWDLLGLLGSDLAQGYYLCRPIPAADSEQITREVLAKLEARDKPARDRLNAAAVV